MAQRMPRPCDFPLAINDVTGRHTVKPELLRGSRHPASWACPHVEAVRPCTFCQMGPSFTQLVVNAQSDDLDPILPLGILFPERLQLSHRPLARPTPRGPPLQHHYLAAEIGQLGVGFIVQPDERDLRSGGSRWKRPMLSHVVLKSQVREFLFSEQAFRESLPSNLIFAGPSVWTALTSACCQGVFARDGMLCLRFLVRLHAKGESERASRDAVNDAVSASHMGMIRGCILECDFGPGEINSQDLGLR